MAKKKKFRKAKKTRLVFDEKERKDFLLGFQKRKAERKQKVKEKLEKQMKEMRLQMRKDKREAMKKMYLNLNGDPDLDAVLKEDAKIYDLPEQVVKVTPLDPNEISGKLDLSMGYNKSKSGKKRKEECPEDDS